MFGHGHVYEATPLMGEQHQHEQESTGRRGRYEKVRRHNLSHMIAKKVRQVCDGGRPATADHVLRHGCLTDVDAEFQQFAVDPRRAPPRVRVRHRANQRPNVGREGR
jgi:hypothetical protein